MSAHTIFSSTKGRLNSYKIGAKPVGKLHFKSNSQWSTSQQAVILKVCFEKCSQKHIIYLIPLAWDEAECTVIDFAGNFRMEWTAHSLENKLIKFLTVLILAWKYMMLLCNTDSTDHFSEVDITCYRKRVGNKCLCSNFKEKQGW